MEVLDAAILVRMTGAMKAELTALSNELGVPEAALMRQALAALIRNERRKRPRAEA